jgi:hypothetical protein
MEEVCAENIYKNTDKFILKSQAQQLIADRKDVFNVAIYDMYFLTAKPPFIIKINI